MQLEILFTGIGGQGVQLVSKTLALAAVSEGRQVSLTSHPGGGMRGGRTDAEVVICDSNLTSPPILPSAGSAFVMHPKFWAPNRDRLRPEAFVVANSSLVDEGELAGFTSYWVPASQISMDLGNPLTASFVLLGAFCALTSAVGVQSVVDAMAAQLPARRAQHREANEAAIRAGGVCFPDVVRPVWPQGARA
jgi:Pyruvate/2-oxoacid:ferredoxin oxidoreductase gamma subunit